MSERYAARVVAEPGRLGEQRLVVARRASLLLRERAPEAELVAELRRVAAVEEHLEEARRLGVLLRLRVREPEVERVPARLARDRLEDVRVDLRQRVVARERAERPRQPRVAARVVERVARLVEERLVVGEAALRARDQVDDLGRRRPRSRRRAGSSAAGPRGRGGCSGSPRGRSPSARTVSTHTSTERSFGYVDSSGDSRRSQRDVRARRQLGALRAEQPLEPALCAAARTRLAAASAARRSTSSSSRSEICFCGLVPATASRSPESAASRSLRATSSSRRCSLKPRVELLRQLTELVALRVLGEDGELRACAARSGSSSPSKRQPRREDRVLELVLVARRARPRRCPARTSCAGGRAAPARLRRPTASASRSASSCCRVKRSA